MEFKLDQERADACYESLLKILDFSPRSEKEAKEKLYAKGYHQDEVTFAIDKAKKYRFINDEEFVRVYISSYKGKYGKKKIEYKLTTEKGVDGTLVRNALEDMIEDDEEFDTCKSFALKYINSKHITDRKDYQKLANHLYQKGFNYSLIGKVCEQVFDEMEK